ncbi:MAG: hypothetical protein Q4C96_04490 [Planctomycetia bacterium]|nr:hypothetical protein [Planctomycetia bacterium]
MARRRLNIKFIVILLVIIVVGGFSAYFMWKMNSSRIVEGFYVQGVALYENPETRGQSVEPLLKYARSDVKVNEEHRADALRKLALYYVDTIDRYAGNRDMVYHISDIMQRALQTDARNSDLKKAMAKAYMVMRQFAAAADLYGRLSSEFPTEPEYMYLYAESLIESKQIDQAGIALRNLRERHSSYIPGYMLTVRYNEQVLARPDAAEVTMDEMVEANPLSASAYARRSIYRLDHKNMEGAKTDLDEALSLDDRNLDVIIAAANYYILTRDFEIARGYLESVPEEFRANEDIADLGIRLADAEKKPDVAVSIIREKLKRKDSPILRIQLFDRLVTMRRLDEARKEIEYLKRMQISIEHIGFFESAIDIIEGNWHTAMKKLELARGPFSAFPESMAYLDRQLALCYGKLGQIDKQLDAFQRSIENTPLSEIKPVSVAYIIALHSAGKIQRLEEALRALETKIGEKEVMNIPQLRSIKLALQTQKLASQHKGKLEGNELKEILQKVGVKEDSPEAVLIAVRMAMKSGNSDEARKILTAAMDKDSDFAGYVSYLALVEANDGNFDKAISILDEQIQKRGAIPGLMIIKTRLVGQMEAKQAVPHLRKIEEVAKTMPAADQLLVMKQLGTAWLMTGDTDNAKRIFEFLAEREEDNIGTKIHLFELAKKMDDEKEMDRLMEQIQKIMGPQSPDYRYCQASKIIWEFSKKRTTATQLAEAKSFLSQAKETRPNWANIPRAQAELSLLEGNYGATIDHLYRVDTLGALTVPQLELLVKLLRREGRDQDIKELLENKQGVQLTPEIIRISVEVGEGDKDIIERAMQIVSDNSPGDQLWMGHIYMREKNYEKAEVCFKKTVELSPENSTGWISLLQAMKLQGASKQELQVKIDDMQLALPKQKRSLAIGKALQILEDAPAAEKAFLTALNENPQDLETLYFICSFYMETTHPEFAEPYLLRMVDNLVENPTDNYRLRTQQLTWTRRSLAQIYGLKSDYERQEKALNLLDENLRLDPESLEDKKIKGIILASRENPRQQRQAMDLLESVGNMLSNSEKFILAKLYESQSVGTESQLLWDKCVVIMKQLTDLKTNKNPEYLIVYVDMLLRRKHSPTDIETYIKRLDELAPNSIARIGLRARLMQQTGNTDGAQRMLLELMPSSLKEEESARRAKEVAILLEEIGSVDAAERVLQRITNETVGGAALYAAFLGRHGRVSIGMDILEKHAKDFSGIQLMDAVCTLFRYSKRGGSEAEFNRARGLLEKHSLEVDSVVASLFMGQLYELQGNYTAAMNEYTNILKNPKTTTTQNAFAQNNLSYLMALTDKDVPGALAMINEAISTVGLEAGVLDTRAVVSLRTDERIRIDQAVRDLEMAITVERKPIYYFHLASAYLKKEDLDSAKVAFQIARQLDPNLQQNIPRLEREDYSRLLTTL